LSERRRGKSGIDVWAAKSSRASLRGKRRRASQAIRHLTDDRDVRTFLADLAHIASSHARDISDRGLTSLFFVIGHHEDDNDVRENRFTIFIALLSDDHSFPATAAAVLGPAFILLLLRHLHLGQSKRILEILIPSRLAALQAALLAQRDTLTDVLDLRKETTPKFLHPSAN
jgi:hypothetical protein